MRHDGALYYNNEEKNRLPANNLPQEGDVVVSFLRLLYFLNRFQILLIYSSLVKQTILVKLLNSHLLVWKMLIQSPVVFELISSWDISGLLSHRCCVSEGQTLTHVCRIASKVLFQSGCIIHLMHHSCHKGHKLMEMVSPWKNKLLECMVVSALLLACTMPRWTQDSIANCLMIRRTELSRDSLQVISELYF